MANEATRNLEDSDSNNVLSVSITGVFMKAILENSADSSLKDDEKEARRLLLSSLMLEVNDLVKTHQSKVKNVSSDLFALANLASKLSA